MMNHKLEPAASRDGLHKQVREFIARELRSLQAVIDTSWIRRRLRTSGVNTVGTDKVLLAYWYRDVDTQMAALWPDVSAKLKSTRRVAAAVQPHLRPGAKQLGLFERPRLLLYP